MAEIKVRIMDLVCLGCDTSKEVRSTMPVKLGDIIKEDIDVCTSCEGSNFKVACFMDAGYVEGFEALS